MPAATQVPAIQITTGNARPISMQIANGIGMDIATVELKPADPVPSIRGLVAAASRSGTSDSAMS